MAVPEYLTAYEKDGKPICPECGVDLQGQSAASIRAHSANHWADIDPHEVYAEARRRRAILEKIAKEAEA